MYESKTQQPLASAGFARRLLGHLLVAIGLLGLSLALGMIGYVLFENLSWLDAFLNAANAQDGNGYAVFGKVTSGMEVVDKIRMVKTSPRDVPLAPVTIQKATLEK